MCMGGPCELDYQLTCHRYMADPTNYAKAMIAVYNITGAHAPAIKIVDGG